MSRASSQLRLDPNRCDRCGRCERVCDKGALKVGASYIFVDWQKCDACFECVDACDRGAIERKGATGARVAAVSAGKAARGQGAASAEAKGSGRGASSSTGPKPRARTVGAPVHWTLAEAAAVLAVTFAAFLGKDVLLAQKWVIALTPSSHVLARVAALAAYYAIQVGALLLLVRMRDRDFLESVRLRVPKVGWLERLASTGITLGLTGATLVAGFAYAFVAQEIGFVPDNPGVAELFGPNATGFFFSVMLVAFVAPVAEEVVFRGVLLGALQSRWPMWPSIIVAAAVFSAFHVSWWTLVPTLMVGIAAGWLSVRRTSLWPAITLHALYNLTLVTVAYAGAL
ncbi:MAG: CPBP family glutamic-type intramembrane protease [Coriobacteriia bacterium]|nr:CPBP family glutamic-type intramembrane protease [Coriobacteriia bacterium]